MDLLAAELAIVGRITVASNMTLLCELGGGTASSGDAAAERVVYKPIRGEAPLWDFPDGTLAGREVATYRVSDALGWDLVPETVLRDGPLGQGMVQRWIDEADPDQADERAGTARATDPVDIFGLDEVPDDYRPVLTTYVEDDDAERSIREVALAHAQCPDLLRLAVFDVVVNNADRKGGHILTDAAGRVYGVDHGICLHSSPKLRTVLWGWAGEPVPEPLLADLVRFADAPPNLDGLITDQETEALIYRARALATSATMPQPTSQRPIPWPPF